MKPPDEHSTDLLDALRRDRDDAFSAELDVPGTVLPISRRVYQELTQKL